MLLAFALEVILKAVLLAEGGRAVDGRGRLTEAFWSHDLKALYESTSLPPLSLRDDIMLTFLTSYVEVGRYPIRARHRPTPSRNLLFGATEVRRTTVAVFRPAEDALRHQGIL